eukprot:12435809-Alexandrium_andersonii.AAC.1
MLSGCSTSLGTRGFRPWAQEGCWSEASRLLYMQTQRVGALCHHSRYPHAPLPAAAYGSSVIAANKVHTHTCTSRVSADVCECVRVRAGACRYARVRAGAVSYTHLTLPTICSV